MPERLQRVRGIREALRRRWQAWVRRAGRAARAVRSARAEILDATGILAGWTLVTWPTASLLSTWQVWPYSAGLLVLSAVGWKHMATIFREGLYVLTRPRDET